MVPVTYTNGTDMGNYTPKLNEELQMISKIAFQLIREVKTENPLSIFEKMPINKGDTVEQAVIKLVESNGYDFEGDGALKRNKAQKMAVRYFRDWTRKVFDTTVDLVQVRECLLNGTPTDEIVTKLVSTLSSSDRYENYINIRDLFKFGSTAGASGTPFVDVGTVAKVDGKTDYKGILRKIKNTVKGMTFVNDKFNKAGIKRNTNIEDIIIVMPYTLKNAIDVDELSGVFNLSKAEIESRIIETDSEDNIVYIVDKNAILVFTKLYEMMQQPNAKGLFYNYFLHTERMYAISPLFDGTYFAVE